MWIIIMFVVQNGIVCGECIKVRSSLVLSWAHTLTSTCTHYKNVWIKYIQKIKCSKTETATCVKKKNDKEHETKTIHY